LSQHNPIIDMLHRLGKLEATVGPRRPNEVRLVSASGGATS
jgi:hypothetical protein